MHGSAVASFYNALTSNLVACSRLRELSALLLRASHHASWSSGEAAEDVESGQRIASLGGLDRFGRRTSFGTFDAVTTRDLSIALGFGPLALPA